MKRFAVFSGPCYYPAGGWGDFKGSFDTVEEAKASPFVAATRGDDWWEIVDLQEGVTVEVGGA